MEFTTVTDAPTIKSYLSALPWAQREKAIVRIRRGSCMTEHVFELDAGNFEVGVNQWNVRFVPSLLSRETFLVEKIGKTNFLSTLIFAHFPATCDCPDYKNREDSKMIPCKHVWAAVFHKYGWDTVSRSGKPG